MAAVVFEPLMEAPRLARLLIVIVDTERGHGLHPAVWQWWLSWLWFLTRARVWRRRHEGGCCGRGVHHGDGGWSGGKLGEGRSLGG